MLEMERRRLTQEGKSPAEVNIAVKAFVEFYSPVSYTHLDVYKRQKMMSAETVARAVVYALLLPDNTTAEKIVVMPSVGTL